MYTRLSPPLLNASPVDLGYLNGIVCCHGVTSSSGWLLLQYHMRRPRPLLVTNSLDLSWWAFRSELDDMFASGNESTLGRLSITTDGSNGPYPVTGT